MKQAISRFAAVLVGFVLVGALPVRAGDLLPPCWRGQPGATLQIWNFNGPANPAVPDAGANAYGSASATMAPGTGAGGWINTLTAFGTNQGIWDLGRYGTMSLSIPNAPVTAGAWKLVSVQVTQFRGAVYNSNAPVTLSGATLLGRQVQTNNAITNGLKGAWIVERTLWLLDPSPASETVIITAGYNSSAIDQVVVDTLSTSGDVGDVYAPCWRGQAGTTFANWSFHTSANPALPEAKNNPGQPQAAVSVGVQGLGWNQDISLFGCRQGVWDLGVGGTIAASIPETAGSGSSYRYVRVQVVEYYDPSTYASGAAVSVAGATAVGTPQMQVLESNPYGGFWVTRQTVWRLAPAGGATAVTLTGSASGALVDQLTVDTLTLDPGCPPNLTLSADSNACSRAGVTWAVPVVDGCIITNVVSVPPVGSTLPVGTNAVVRTVYDREGGTQVCNFVVVIQDTQAPVAVPPANLTVPAVAGQCGTTVSFAATATDNCPGATVQCSPPSGSLFPLGVSTVTCVARDAAGNYSAPAQFTIRVVDLTGDLSAPCWRGRTNATFQQWAFSTGATNVSPERSTNAHAGMSQAAITPGLLGLGWQEGIPGWGCRQGYWDLGMAGTIALQFPDQVGPVGAYRLLRLQVTQFYQDGTYDEPLTVTLPGATAVGVPLVTSIETNGFGGEWIVRESLWRVPTATSPQTLTLTSGLRGALVDQVVVDTLTIEPVPCPESFTVNSTPGLCGATNVTWAVPAADGCVIQSVVDSPASGSAFGLGLTPVTRTVTDASGQTSACVFTVTVIDAQAPVISAVAVSQVQPYTPAAVNVKDCAAPVVQGVVNIAVTATDACPLSPPVIGLTNGVTGELATFVSQVGNVFNYTWPVTGATASGTWTATVAAADTANVTAAGFTVCVNPRQILGQVELQGFVGTGTVPAHARAVTFVATEVTLVATNVLRSWTVTLTNVSGAVFNYALADVPVATTHLSAKTAWNLRRKVPVSFAGVNGSASFTSPVALRGGDLTGDNVVNALDYGLLRVNFTGTSPAADITGDGVVNTFDLGILRVNFTASGDAP